MTVATRPRGSWLTAANAVVLGWLAAVAVSVVLFDPLGLPDWLPVHMFLLGAVSSAILIWSEHFAVAVLHTGQPALWTRVARLATLNAGALAVLVGRMAGVPALLAAGTVTVLAAVAGHLLLLWRLRRRALRGTLAGIVDYYLAAGVALLAGGTIGALLGTGVGGAGWHDRLFAAHVHLNLLGWVLLTVLGTLFMLWPVVLRTRIGAGTATAVRWCLRLAGPGLAVALAGMLTGIRPVAAAGLAGYLAGVVMSVRPLLAAARARVPHSGAAWQLAAATGWLAIVVTADLVIVAVTPAAELPQRLAALGPVLLVGVIAQVLLGSLVHLLPVAAGGGPQAVRAAASIMDLGWPVRLAVCNLAAGLLAVPGLPGPARTAGWWLAAIAVIDVVARAAWLLAGPGTRRRGRQRRTGVGVAAGAAAGAVLTVIAVLAAAGGTAPTGATVGGAGVQEVRVELASMRITPPVLTVAEGVHLRLVVVNRDTQPHDLRLDSGQRTALLDAGERATLDVGRVGDQINGWCTVAGHRAAGMTLQIRPGPADPSAGAHHRDHGHGDQPAIPQGPLPQGPLDLTAPFSPGFTPYPAWLEPAPGTTVHRVDLRVVEQDLEVAPGVRQPMWTFGGTVPGPVLRGNVGDLFEITLSNDGSLGHGIDFHASALAPAGPMRVLAPGERLTYRFRADQAGIWLYHCSTPPQLHHVGNGMYGAVIIDPPDLPPVNREYLLVAGELYLGQPGGSQQVAKLRAGTPDAWLFNGAAAGYTDTPLPAAAGERVRVWVLAAGPASGVSFHIIGTRFDTVYKEGGWLLQPDRGSGGAQALDLAPGQGGFVELTFPEPGDYPFVDHNLRHADAGATGRFTVAEPGSTP